MKGDYTRDSHRPERAYTSVRMQQGRVPLDADWNEMEEIRRKTDRAVAQDAIGLKGGFPMGTDFQIVSVGGKLRVLKGRAWLGGNFLQNHADVDVGAEPFASGEAPPGAGRHLVYLDAWERHVTALEDPEIREKALGGPDTATRLQHVWQVRFLAVEPGVGCEAAESLPGNSPARLAARARQPDAVEACTVTPGARYRRLENQLYRVEVHTPGDLTAARFKWSRDNGTVAATATVSGDRRVTVSDVGRDPFLRFQAGGAVELSDEARERRGDPGDLFTVARLEGNVLILDPGGPAPNAADYGPGLIARRWDSPGAVPFVATEDDFMALEDGVQVRLSGSDFRVGDYWMIPARTADSDVWWPLTSGGQPRDLAPHGVKHRYLPLAVVERVSDTAGDWQVTDCRDLFVPLTDVASLQYLGGDGQEAAQGTGGALPAPLRVGISRGIRPVAGARVRFRVAAGTGKVDGGDVAIVTTGADGVAQAVWTVDGSNPVQTVVAEWTNPAGGLKGLPITFTATLAAPSAGGGRPCCYTVGEGGDFPDLEAVGKFVEAQKVRDLCLCLLPGVHLLKEAVLDGAGDNSTIRSVEIHGSPLVSVIVTEGPFLVRNLVAFTLRDVILFSRGQKEGAVILDAIGECRLDSVEFLGVTTEPLEPVVAASRILNLDLRDCVVIPYGERPQDTTGSTDLTVGDRVFRVDEESLRTLGGNRGFARITDTDRIALREGLTGMAERTGTRARRARAAPATDRPRLVAENRYRLSRSEAAVAISRRDGTEDETLALTKDVVIRPGAALVLGDALGDQRIEGNTMFGWISTYGRTGEDRFSGSETKILQALFRKAPPEAEAGGHLFLRDNECFGILLGGSLTNVQDGGPWQEAYRQEPPKLALPVYASVHASGNYSFGLGVELFGASVTAEGNRLITFPKDGQMGLVLIAGRAVATGNLAALPINAAAVVHLVGGAPAFAEAGNLFLSFF